MRIGCSSATLTKRFTAFHSEEANFRHVLLTPPHRVSSSVCRARFPHGFPAWIRRAGMFRHRDQPHFPLEIQLASVHVSPAFCVDLISKVKICFQHCCCWLVTEPKRVVSSIYRETQAGRLWRYDCCVCVSEGETEGIGWCLSQWHLQLPEMSSWILVVCAVLTALSEMAQMLIYKGKSNPMSCTRPRGAADITVQR